MHFWRGRQHNLRVAAKYYARIRMSRLAHLLGLSPDETEKQLATLVSEGQVAICFHPRLCLLSP